MAEILAPCGSFETLAAALRAGADAVYLGGESFSARQNAENFTNVQLAEAVKVCHKRGVKVYQAINTLIFDSQLEECISAVKLACETGIDGLITQDLALVQIVKKCCPDLEIHASTQMNVHTEDGVEMTKQLGFSRAVLSRELPFDTIKELCKLGTEIEVFVHGALCMSVSGQCYMSGVIGSRSANRGLCAQACRLPCSAVKGGERYDLSLKDMSYIDRLKKLENCGVASLKIEGRMKRPEYVAAAVDSCKKALEGREYDRKILADVFSRGGFTDGYFTGKLGNEMFGTRGIEDVKATAEALPKIHEIYRCEEKRDTVSFDFSAQSGKNISLKISDKKGNSAEVFGDIPQTAKNRSVDAETVKKQLSKLGDTIYSFGELICRIDDNLFVSPSELNRLRREACERLDEKRCEANTKIVSFIHKDLCEFSEIVPKKFPKVRMTVRDISQLENVDLSEIETAFVPLYQWEKAAEIYPKNRIGAVMPRFTFDEKKQRSVLEKLKQLGLEKILAANLAHVKEGTEFGLEVHLDYSFNLTNSLSLRTAKELGAKDAVVSFELKAGQINSLKKPLPIGIFAYGRLPLMLTVNCPVNQSVGCKNCSHALWDRTGRQFYVKCSKTLGYTEVMNSEILYIPHKLDRFKGLDFICLNFCDESPEEVCRIIEDYKNRTAREAKNITSGLYFRGVY